jgi:hypothetical protein
MLRWLAPIAMLLASPAAAQLAVHGENSIFVSPTVKLGWAVKRGASEIETLVIVRVIAMDPFSKDRKVFVTARPLERETDIAIPRAQFADHLSTEFHFFSSADDVTANHAALIVFYLGVPDTTPEFAGQAEAEAYLAQMLRK